MVVDLERQGQGQVVLALTSTLTSTLTPTLTPTLTLILTLTLTLGSGGRPASPAES